MFYKSLCKINWLFLFLGLACSLFTKQVDTFYGVIEVQEPVLLELIDSPAFQRLKFIHQYGVAYYTSYKEEYNRYDHSIGVFAILRAKGASLEEQVAGLLHDVSHTAFSHVGDWVFEKVGQDKDYQSSIHLFFLEKSGLGDILKKYGFTLDQIIPNEDLFPLLESKLPNLCADRIDYNIQGAYYQGFITYEEAVGIFEDLQFIDNIWVSTQAELMKKLTRSSLFMTEYCWGGPTNYMISRWLADAILRGIQLGSITFEELHFGTDQAIWDKLIKSKDLIIQENMKRIMDPETYFSISDSALFDFTIKSKFRGIDPWIISGSKYLRITLMDPSLAEEYDEVKQKVQRGWSIKVNNFLLK